MKSSIRTTLIAATAGLAATVVAASAGDLPPRVQVQLGSAASDYNRGDYPDAWFRFWTLALDGNAVAQFNLGQLYRQGIGIPADLQLARYWYAEAAAQGHAYAQYNLGLLYELGHGTRQDAVEARAWYRRAANADLEVAQAALQRLDSRVRA